MTNFDSGAFYDTAYVGAEDVFAIADPEQAPAVKEFAKAADEALGLDLRKDLLDSLGDKVVFYTSPSEGPLSLGMTLMVRVKDAKKAQEALDQAVKGLGKASGADLTLKKKTYHGVEMREVRVAAQGFIFVPSYVIYKDWLVIAPYPQQVQGYILRAKGDLAAWKPDQRVQKSLAELPKEFISISYDDPRPTIREVLSIAPLVGGTVNSFVPDSKFEVGSLPNAQEATEHLFPNVAVTTDDGKTLRVETRASLALPVDVTGLDAYGVFVFFGAFRFAMQ